MESIESIESIIPFLIGDLSRDLEANCDAHEVTYVTSMPRLYSTVVIVKASFPDGIRKLYVKVVSSKEESSLNIEFQLLGQLYEHFKKHPQYSTIKPIAYLPQYRAIVTEAAPGRILQSLLARRSRIYMPFPLLSTSQTCCYNAGRWLKMLHRDVSVDVILPVVESKTIIEYCMLRLNLLCQMEATQFVAYKNRVNNVLNNHRQMIEADLDERKTCLHGDYTTNNLIVYKNKVTGLDFTAARFGSPYFDFCKFWVNIEQFLESPLCSHRFIKEWQMSFLSGYANSVDQDHPLFSIYQLPHRLADLLRLQRLFRQSPLQRILSRRLYQQHLHAIDMICYS